MCAMNFNYNPATREIYLNGNYVGEFDGDTFVPGKDLLEMNTEIQQNVAEFAATINPN